MYSMKEPSDDERTAFKARMIAHLDVVEMLHAAAVELHRQFDRNAAILRLGLDLTGQDRDATQEAENRWDQALKVARPRLGYYANKSPTRRSAT